MPSRNAIAVVSRTRRGRGLRIAVYVWSAVEGAYICAVADLVASVEIVAGGGEGCRW